MIAVDASAIVAILCSEPEQQRLVAALDRGETAITSPIAVYEAALAVSRRTSWKIAEAEHAVHDFLKLANVQIAPLDAMSAHAALEAFARYGKGGGHPAKLNLGDCFAYAQARISKASLLYVGDDFSQTDIATAAP